MPTKPWTADEGGWELDEAADVAAERALREVDDDEWRRSYKDVRVWLVGRTESMRDWSDENHDADRVALQNYLGKFGTASSTLPRSWAGTCRKTLLGGRSASVNNSPEAN